jgi:hypothetical protein
MQIPLSDEWRLALSGDVKLYENDQTLPRAFVVPQAQTLPDSWDGTEQALNLMNAPDFDPQTTVVLSTSDEIVPPSTLNAQPSALITSYTSTRIEIDVLTDAPGYLVLSDAYFPGWSATVNDKPTTLYRADVMFRAVRVPEGESTVVMTYQPGWLAWVFPLGALGWAGITIWIGFGLWWNKNRDQGV